MLRGLGFLGWCVGGRGVCKLQGKQDELADWGPTRGGGNRVSHSRPNRRRPPFFPLCSLLLPSFLPFSFFLRFSPCLPFFFLLPFLSACPSVFLTLFFLLCSVSLSFPSNVLRCIFHVAFCLVCFHFMHTSTFNTLKVAFSPY